MRNKIFALLTLLASSAYLWALFVILFIIIKNSACFQEKQFLTYIFVAGILFSIVLVRIGVGFEIMNRKGTIKNILNYLLIAEIPATIFLCLFFANFVSLLLLIIYYLTAYVYFLPNYEG